MTIASRLRIIALLSAGLVLAVSLIFIPAFLQQKRARERANFAADLMRGSFELSLLSSGYLRNPDQRSKEQWMIRHNALTRAIAQLPVQPEDRTLIRRIDKNLEDLRSLFERMIEYHGPAESRPADRRGAIAADYRDQLGNLIMRRSQELSLDASRVAAINTDQIERINTLIFLSLPAAGLLALLLGGLIFTRISRRIGQGIGELRTGAAAFGSGNLDYRIPAGAKDELGALALSMNDMAGSLKSLTVSRDELLNEIAERKRIETELRESRRRLQDVIDGSSSLIFVKDLEGRFLIVNKTFARLLDLPAAEVQGRTDYDMMPESQAGSYQEHDRQVMESGNPMEFEEVAEFGGTRHLLQTNKFLLYDYTGKPYGLCGVSVDITARKRAENELKRLVRELERSNRELEQFAYVASHDLQEPLRMVASYVQLIEKRYRDRLDDRAEKYINFAVDGVKRMQKLIDGLLAYSRVARGAPFAPVDANKALDHALADLSLAIRESGATVERGPLPVVTADETQLTQLFLNLIGNAIKFRKKEEPLTVRVSASRTEKEWRFSVADNGIGMDQRHSDRIFQIFQRLHGREEYSGTGIGLALCKRIVERHHGRIWVETEPGRGSLFHFTIPDTGGEA